MKKFLCTFKSCSLLHESKYINNNNNNLRTAYFTCAKHSLNPHNSLNKTLLFSFYDSEISVCEITNA